MRIIAIWMAATFWVFPNQEVAPRGAVFASHTPLSHEQQEVLVSFAQPGLDLRAQQVRATVHTVGDRVTILDGSLGGHSQSKKIIEAIRGALREGRRSDLTWTADSPQVAPLIQQAFGSRSMAVAGIESSAEAERRDPRKPQVSSPDAHQRRSRQGRPALPRASGRRPAVVGPTPGGCGLGPGKPRAEVAGLGRGRPLAE